MYVGFLTGCLEGMNLEKKARWASENGFKALEVSCWPKNSNRDYSGCDIDVGAFTVKQAENINAYMKSYGLSISSLAYYDNNLDRDPDKRKFINNHTKKCIDAAAMLDVGMVGTFVGRNIDKAVRDNFDEFEKVFSDLVGYAEKKGVKIIIENCPMIGWQRYDAPGTISFTPELWEEMFRRIPSNSFGLNLDPSHLLFQLIDYIELLPKFKDRIFHVHAKDSEVFSDRLKWYGVYDSQLGISHGYGQSYWRFRMPGLGQVDWKAFIAGLKSIGYDGVLSIEHEDLLYEGSPDRVKEGLILGKDFIEKLI